MAYMRKGSSPEDSLLVICNFTEEIFQPLEIGVPYEGRYKEILNSDSEMYGGEGEVNPRARLTKKGMADEREHILQLHIGPESVAIFRYQGK
jgi:1,4-alpha-glucan branching enzyme